MKIFFFVAELPALGSCSGVTTGLPLAERAVAPALRTLGVRDEERRGVSPFFLSSYHLRGGNACGKNDRAEACTGRDSGWAGRVLRVAFTWGTYIGQPTVDRFCRGDGRLRPGRKVRVTIRTDAGAATARTCVWRKGCPGGGPPLLPNWRGGVACLATPASRDLRVLWLYSVEARLLAVGTRESAGVRGMPALLAPAPAESSVIGCPTPLLPNT